MKAGRKKATRYFATRLNSEGSLEIRHFNTIRKARSFVKSRGLGIWRTILSTNQLCEERIWRNQDVKDPFEI